MRIRTLGRSGLRVSDLCLGAMTFGMPEWGCDERESLALIDRYLAAGGNFIDTADAYSGTISEEICGKAMAGRRAQIVLATKATMPVGSGPNDRGSSRKHLRESCDASLRRLRTDYIDLYQIHDFIQTWLGNRRHGWARFVSLQPQYNLLVRTIEREHFALATEEGIGLITWSPLAAGMLTGKITRERKPPESRLAQRDMPLYRFYFNERAFGIVDVLVAAAREADCTPAQLALAWQLEKPEITSVIIGARSLAQLEDNLGATAVHVSPEIMTRLEDATRIAPEYPGVFIDFIQTWLGNR